MIVALDSTDEAANYIHIADAKENANYYCPCCKGLIKPRAYKKDVKYQVQPHYYHESGGCSEESFVHYICKTWLFEKGCKFIVSNIEYEVDSIETEKTLHTKFGDYRPDIIVNTESGKTFFFEIKYSNCKTELYAPKWDELGNDVVEVDTREFINNKHGCTIPEFKLIYSNGECFIKSYSRTDYEEIIAKTKLQWKRQDKLNYKIKWERLDWFWTILQNYFCEKDTLSNLCDAFANIEFKDQKFILSKFKSGKHKEVKKYLENYYSNAKEIENVRLKKFTDVIRKLNKEFGYSSTNLYEDTYLFRKNYDVIFKDSSDWTKRSYMKIKNDTTTDDLFNYFHPIMAKYHEEFSIPFRFKHEENIKRSNEIEKYKNNVVSKAIGIIKEKFNKSAIWEFNSYTNNFGNSMYITITLLNEWRGSSYFDIEEMYEQQISYEKVYMDFIEKLTVSMQNILSDGRRGNRNCRLMELLED